MGAGAARAEGVTAVGEQVRRLEDQLDLARRHLEDLRRLLRHLAHDLASAAAVRAAVDAALAGPGWPEDAVAYVREVLAPVWNFAWLVPGRLAGCGRPDTQARRAVPGRPGRARAALAGGAAAGRLARGERDHEPPPRGAGRPGGAVPGAVRGRAARDRPPPGGRPAGGGALQAGIGRTGTVLASYLVRHGATAAEAIAEVRRVYHPRAVENAAQEDSVRRFADSERSVTPRVEPQPAQTHRNGRCANAQCDSGSS